LLTTTSTRPCLGDDLLDHGVDIDGVADIGVDRTGASVGGGLANLVLVAVHEVDIGAEADEETAEFETDTAGSAGDDHGLFGEVECQVPHMSSFDKIGSLARVSSSVRVAALTVPLHPTQPA